MYENYQHFETVLGNEDQYNKILGGREKDEECSYFSESFEIYEFSGIQKRVWCKGEAA